LIPYAPPPRSNPSAAAARSNEDESMTQPSQDRGSDLVAQRVSRRAVIGTTVASGVAALACNSPTAWSAQEAKKTSESSGAPRKARKDWPVLVGSTNALAGMKLHYAKLAEGGDPLDVAIEVVKVTEADPNDDSVGLGGLPNEDGVVQLDAACMYGPRHKSGAVGCIENIMHPSEVARLVMERTDHCLLVGKGAYEFARKHGHPHVDLLTEPSRKKWLEWKENLSKTDDWLPPPKKIPYQSGLPTEPPKVAREERRYEPRQTGTIHCSALAKDGAIACTTSTSGLAWKIPGRVGDSAIVGAGLYCDQEVGSAGSTGRGEANILVNGGFAIVELMRQGASPLEAGLEVLKRVTRETQRQSRYQPELVDKDNLPAFGLKYYILALDGTFAGVSLRGEGDYAVSDPEHGPRLEKLVALHPKQSS
jgi:N4-(beta-N-acetylglucosaminyl)-L-asparaginase